MKSGASTTAKKKSTIKNIKINIYNLDKYRVCDSISESGDSSPSLTLHNCKGNTKNNNIIINNEIAKFEEAYMKLKLYAK